MTFLLPNIIDLLDIAIVAFIIYQIIIIIKTSAGNTIFFGFLFLLVIYLIAQILDLKMLLSIFSIIKRFWILMIFILFQNEIKQFLSLIVAEGSFFPGWKKNSDLNSIKKIISAVISLSFRKVGAIIVFEGKDKLDDIITTKGEVIDADISTKLILTVFNKNTMLHDGAMIIRNNRIYAVKVILPNSPKKEFNQEFGTRHLAAIGATERSDAFCIVVSEENGKISVTKNGEITIGISKEELMQRLLDEIR